MLGVRYGTALPFWEYGFALLYIPLAVALILGCVCASRALKRMEEEEGAEEK